MEHEHYLTIPNSIRKVLDRYSILLLYDKKEKCDTAYIAKNNKQLSRFVVDERYIVVSALSPEDFLIEFDNRQFYTEQEKRLLNDTPLTGVDDAYLVGRELLRLEILSLAKEKEQG